MKLAALFPGQGSQGVGMAVDLVAKYPSAAGRFTEAADVLGYDLAAVCATGPEEKLGDTLVAQPALYVAGYATFEALSSAGFAPSFVAGHSLGEYTAAAAAGCFPFADGLRAVKARAEAMAACAASRPGAMAAILGARGDAVDGWVAAASAHGPIVVANRNAPDQLIVSGAAESVDAVCVSAKDSGCKAIRLKVSGAFHSPLMQDAQDRMKSVLAGVTIGDPRIPVIGNVAGVALGTAALVRDELEAQLISAVRWDAVVRCLAGAGVTRVVECGPGRVLSGLVRKIDRSVEPLSTGGAKELDETLAALAAVGSAT